MTISSTQFPNSLRARKVPPITLAEPGPVTAVLLNYLPELQQEGELLHLEGFQFLVLEV